MSGPLATFHVPVQHDHAGTAAPTQPGGRVLFGGEPTLDVPSPYVVPVTSALGGTPASRCSQWAAGAHDLTRAPSPGER